MRLQFIKIFLKQNDLTEMSERLGVNKTFISRVISGESKSERVKKELIEICRENAYSDHLLKKAWFALEEI